MGLKTSPPQDHIRAAMHIWSRTGQRTKFQAEGHCMSPIIKDGDMVHLVHGQGRFRVGDVVIYGEPDRYKLHRIVHFNRKRNRYLLRGDNSNCIDPPVPPSGILAKAVAVENERGITDFGNWRWRLANPAIARFSYFEAAAMARSSALGRVLYLLGSVVGRRLRNALRPNNIAWRLGLARREKPDGPAETQG